MINCYTASPIEIKGEVDFSRVGTGTGIARHGFGMYFGGPALVNHYFNSYRNYNEAEKQAHLGEQVFREGSDEYAILEKLKSGEIPFEPSDFEHHISLHELGDSEFDLDSVILRSGAVHSASIPNIDLKDVSGWDDHVSQHQLDEIQMALLKNYYSEFGLPELNYEELDLSDDYKPEEIENLLADLYYAAYEDGVENDQWGGISEELLSDAWDFIITGDEGCHEFEQDFLDGVSEKFKTTAMALISVGLQLTEGETTYGDIVHSVNNHFEVRGSSSPGLDAARFLSKVEIPALLADGISRLGKELVVYDEELLNSAKFTVISESELARSIEDMSIGREDQIDEELTHSLAPR